MAAALSFLFCLMVVVSATVGTGAFLGFRPIIAVFVVIPAALFGLRVVALL